MVNKSIKLVLVAVLFLVVGSVYVMDGPLSYFEIANKTGEDIEVTLSGPYGITSARVKKGELWEAVNKGCVKSIYVNRKEISVDPKKPGHSYCLFYRFGIMGNDAQGFTIELPNSLGNLPTGNLPSDASVAPIIAAPEEAPVVDESDPEIEKAKVEKKAELAKKRRQARQRKQARRARRQRQAEEGKRK